MSKTKDLKNTINTHLSSTDLSPFTKFQLSVKNTVFGVLYSLLKEDKTNIALLIIFSIIELIHLLTYSFHPILSEAWGVSTKQITLSIYNVLIKLQIVNYLTDSSQLAFFLVYYLMFFFLILIIIDIVYISYSYNRGFFSQLWPVYVLNYSLKLLQYVLFLPLFRLFLSIFQCKADNSNVYASSMTCFQGFHFIHIFLGIIALLILLIITLLVVLTFYQNYDFGKGEVKIQTNSNGDGFLFFTKIVIVVMFTFLDKGNDSDYSQESNSLLVSIHWIVILILMFLSIEHFYILHRDEVYMFKPIQTYFCVLSCLYLWMNTSLLFAKIISYFYDFKGGIIIFFFGIPLCVLCLIFCNNYNDVITKVNQNLTKQTRGDEIKIQMRNYIELIKTRAKRRQSEVELKGIIKKHDRVCSFSDCPLKMIRELYYNSNNIDFFTKYEQITTMLLSYASRVYSKSLTKFPACTSLRIDFALFLYVHQKQRAKAFSEIETAEKNTLSFEDEFNIFKIKKMIDDEQDMLNTNLPAETLDVESSIAYDSHYRQCQSSILVSARLFLDFWGMLSNSNSIPDIDKLNSLGEKINDCLKNILNHWNRMQHYKPNDPKALKMYSMFSCQILNNKERAKEIMSLAKGTNQLNNENNVNDLEYEHKDELAQGSGILCISAEKDHFGTIMKATGNVSKIFGHLLSDIVGRPIDDFFSEAYNGYISKYLKEYFQQKINESEDDINLLSKENVFLGKASNLRISRIYIKFIGNQTVNEKIQMKLQVRSEIKAETMKSFIKKALFVINSSLNITSYSDDASDLITLLNGKASFDNPNLIYFFPELLRDGIEYDPTQSYTLTETELIEMLNNTDETANINNARDFYLKVKSTKKSKRMPGTYNFFVSPTDDKDLSIYSKVSIKILRDLKTILEEEKANQRKNSEDSSFINDMDMKDIDDSIENNTNNINNINGSRTIEQKRGGQLENLFERIKERMFIVTIEYSINQRIVYKHKYDDNNKIPVEALPSSFNSKMIESPYLRLNIDEILDEIEYSKQKENEEIKKKIVAMESANAVRHSNIMAYLKDKGKFSKLYDFQGVDFMKDYSKQDKEIIGKSLQEMKGTTSLLDPTGKNGMKDSQILKPSKHYRFQQNFGKFSLLKNIKMDEELLKEEDEDKVVNTLSNEQSPNESKNSKDEEEQVEEEEEIPDDQPFEDLRELINLQNEYPLPDFKKQLDQVKDYSKDVHFCLLQNDNLQAQKIQPTQLSLFMKTTEEVCLNTKSTSKKKKSKSKSDKNKEKKQNEDKEKETPPSLIRLRIASFITLLVLLIFNIALFVLNVNANNKTTKNINMINNSYDAINQIVFSSYLVRNLLLSTMPEYSFYLFESSKDNFFTMNINYLTSAQTSLDLIIKNISNSGLQLGKEHEEMIQMAVVPMYFLNENSKSYTTEQRTLIQALSDMRIYILTIANYPQQSLFNNTLVNNLMYNSFNDFLVYLKRSASLYADLLLENNTLNKTIFSVMFALIILIGISETIVMGIFLMNVNKDRTKILYAFYEIPQEYINDLSKNCIKYIERNEKAKENGEEEEEELLDNNFDFDLDEYEILKKGNMKLRNVQDVYKHQERNTFIQVSLIFLVVVLIFMVDFIQNYFLFENLDMIIDVFNTTCKGESQYVYSLNILREKVLEPTYTVNGSTGLMIFNETLQLNYELNSQLLIKSINSKKYFNNAYVSFLNEIFNGDVCSFIQSSVFDCSKALDAIGTYGLEIMTVRFFEFFRLGTRKYLKKKTDNSPIEVLMSDLMKNMTLFDHYYIKPMYDTVTRQMKQQIDDILLSELNIRMIIFIVFLVVLIFGYLLVWLPKQSKLNDEIIRTKKMLEIIPKHILDQIESLKHSK